MYSLGDVSSLMKTQLLFGWEQKAAGLQTQLDSLLTLIDKSLTQIWESSPKEEGTTGIMTGVRILIVDSQIYSSFSSFSTFMWGRCFL